jgi:hypothetical protein
MLGKLSTTEPHHQSTRVTNLNALRLQRIKSAEDIYCCHLSIPSNGLVDTRKFARHTHPQAVMGD